MQICFLCCIPYHKCLPRGSSKFDSSWPKKLANVSIENQSVFFLCMARWERREEPYPSFSLLISCTSKESLIVFFHRSKSLIGI